MKKILTFMLLITAPFMLSAQKQTLDVLSFEAPKGWQQAQSEAGVQLSVSDQKSGGYVIAFITKASASVATAGENFTSEWNRLVKNAVQPSGDPAMEPPSKENGWDVVTGSAGYTDGPDKGVATLLSATAGGQTISVLLMTNTSQYQADLEAFIHSLELSKATAGETGNNTASSAGSASSIVGLWVNYKTEASGYSNGMPLLTAGYFRSEYLFNANGTYVFRTKNWSVYQKEILYIYETGKWSVKGNQLTIQPGSGKGEWWSKAPSGRTTGWGSRVKAADYKLQPVTYTFELHYYSGVKETHLLMQYAKRTERDGQTNSNDQPNNFSYSPRALDKSLIDNPPGSGK
ncbi:MAG: hypothetical protein QM687_02135 [Ferruginibacter sp.]